MTAFILVYAFGIGVALNVGLRALALNLGGS
jgi:hypothetical protein